MNAEKLSDAMQFLDEDLVAAAGERRQAPPRKTVHWVRWGVAAACLCLVAAGAVALGTASVRSGQSPITNLLISLGIISPAPSSVGQYYYDWPEKVLPAPVDPEGEVAILPRWDEMTIVQQFHWLEWEDRGYYGHDAPLPAGKIGDTLGTAELTGQDHYSEEVHRTSAEFFAIQGISTQCAVAVRYDGQNACYPFVNSYYKPATLGQFIDDLNLTENLSFNSIWYDCFSPDGEYTKVEFTGAEAAKIWELLLSDRTVENVERYDNNDAIGQNKMSISIDLTLLGYQNISLAVTDKGYLTTNILDTGKAFYLGSDKVDAFMDYVFENCQGYRIVYDYGDSIQQPEGDDAVEDVSPMTTPYDPNGGHLSPQGTTPPN